MKSLWMVYSSIIIIAFCLFFTFWGPHTSLPFDNEHKPLVLAPTNPTRSSTLSGADVKRMRLITNNESSNKTDKSPLVKNDLDENTTTHTEEGNNQWGDDTLLSVENYQSTPNEREISHLGGYLDADSQEVQPDYSLTLVDIGDRMNPDTGSSEFYSSDIPVTRLEIGAQLDADNPTPSYITDQQSHIGELLIPDL